MDDKQAALRERARTGPLMERARELWDKGCLEPRRIPTLWSSSAPQLKRLNSRKRRLLMQTLYTLLRWERALAHDLGTEAFDDLWAAALDLDGDTPQTDPTGLPPAQTLQILGSLPESLALQLVAALGPAARDFVLASNERAPVCIRVNPDRGTRDSLLERLTRDGIRARAGVLASHSVVLEERSAVDQHPLFQAGWFEIQDEGSQILAELVQPTGTVVDWCAGAGGKTLAMAPFAKRVIACDVRAGALAECGRRLKRAGAQAELVHLEPHGDLPKTLREGMADRVLVDAPCSGSGVLRRQPHHRRMIDPESLARLTQLQADILHRAARLVRPGGRLVYGTCSVLPQENDAVVDAFLGQTDLFEELPVSEVLGADYGQRLRLYPHQHGTDGFFGALLQRRTTTATTTNERA